MQLFTFPLSKDLLGGVRLDDILKILKSDQTSLSPVEERSKGPLEIGVILERGRLVPVFDPRKALPDNNEIAPPTRILLLPLQGGDLIGLATHKMGRIVREKTVDEKKHLGQTGLPFMKYTDTIDGLPLYVFDLKAFATSMNLLPNTVVQHQNKGLRSMSEHNDQTEPAKAEDTSTELLNQVGKTAREIQKILSMSDSMMDAMKMMETHLPQTSTGLQSVSKMTEEAAHKLLSGFEESLETNRKLKESLKKIKENPSVAAAESQTMETLLLEEEERILHGFEAMVFQDLVGQNIRKMTGTLNELQSKLLTILKELAPAVRAEGEHTPAQEAPKVDLDLKGTGHPTDVNQMDVDKMLSEFGF